MKNIPNNIIDIKSSDNIILLLYVSPIITDIGNINDEIIDKYMIILLLYR